MNLLGFYRWKEGCRQTEGLVQQIQQIETALLSSMYLVGTAEDSQDKLVGQPLSAGMVHVRGSPVLLRSSLRALQIGCMWSPHSWQKVAKWYESPFEN